jgi:hydroxymethylglutaryl-CoA lyase
LYFAAENASMNSSIQLIECPRDAMQGWPEFIPTNKKIKYLEELLKVGFHTLDFGSFVSPKAIPQMADTREVLASLDWKISNTKLLAIIANARGAEEAASYEGVYYLGFPFSVSPTFQQKNTNSTIKESFTRVKEIRDICAAMGKEMVIYLSMAFGNPYNDPYNEDIVSEWAGKCHELGINIISLADTVGLASPEQIQRLTALLIQKIPKAIIGVHLHSTPENWKAKTEAAYMAGCRRFDGALKGIGGCPMAGNDLVGNMNTEWLIDYFTKNEIDLDLDRSALKKSLSIADEIFGSHA